jgi:hypothetical protein
MEFETIAEVLMRIRLIARYLLREEVMFHVIWVTMAAVALSLYFVPTSTFAQGQGKAQKGFATAQVSPDESVKRVQALLLK